MQSYRVRIAEGLARFAALSLLAALARIALFTPQPAGDAMQLADDSCKDQFR